MKKMFYLDQKETEELILNHHRLPKEEAWSPKEEEELAEEWWWWVSSLWKGWQRTGCRDHRRHWTLACQPLVASVRPQYTSTQFAVHIIHYHHIQRVDFYINLFIFKCIDHFLSYYIWWNMKLKSQWLTWKMTIDHLLNRSYFSLAILLTYCHCHPTYTHYLTDKRTLLLCV